MKTTSRLAVAAAAGLFMGGTAYAGGSVGGDCCADLEERVAELEATTARKGNRKVSLTVYGQVNKAVLFSEEGDNGDVQIIDNTLSQTRFGLRGQAKITSDLYAGYRLEFGVSHNTGSPLNLRHNDLFIGSKTLGQLSIGHGSMATDGIAEIDLSGTTVAGSSDNLVGVFTSGLGILNLDGGRTERVRYDTPSIVGFKLSASWTENEDTSVALRYGSTLGDFTIAAGIGFDKINGAGVNNDIEDIVGSASILHVPTGLNLTFAAGERDFENAALADFDYWYLKGGIKRKIFAAGATAFSVDYMSGDQGPIELDKIGVQFVQNIDAAAMELYASFWSTDTNVVNGDEDALMIGSRIKF